nr:neoverrucotoxin subunit alpha-like isoform X2 [Scatophagus argus]
MATDILEMPGLSRPFTLGMLYDARREKMIPGFSLFGDEVLEKYTSVSTQNSCEFQTIASDSIDSKSSMMNIQASLGVSMLGGLVEVAGSAKYLNDTKKYQNQSRVTLNYKVTTTYKQFTAPPGSVKVQQTSITDQGLATHVVTGILYGANAFFVFDSEKLDDSNLQDIQGKMEAVIKKIPTVSIEGSGSVKLTDEEKTLANNLSCKFHGDFILESLPTTFEDAVKTYQKLPNLLGEGTETVPVKVWLVPLRRFYSKAEQLVREITLGRVRKIHSILQDLCRLKMRCTDSMDDKIVRQFPLIYDRISNFLQIFQDYTLSVKQTIAKKVPLIRGGTEDESSIEKIIADRAKSPFSNENVSAWLDTIEREISALKACVGAMDETQTKFVSNQTELDKEVLAPDAKHAVCFVFTSLDRTDPYPRVLSNFLESPNSEDTTYVPPSTEDLWCFSPRVIIKMKQKARNFSELANNLKDSKNVRFLTAAMANDKYQGATIYYYKEGSLVTDDFTFPRMPMVDNIKDRRDLLWYSCDLSFDPNTLNYLLTLSDDNKHVESGKQQKYRDHPERFDCLQQVMCKERLTGCHYWEVEWTGYVRVGVSYVSIGRKGTNQPCAVGENWSSWALDYEPRKGYSFKHDKTNKNVTVASPGFKRLGVYLDWRAGGLAFFMVSSNEVQHIHSIRTKFTEPVYPAFRLGSGFDHGTVSLL